MKSIEFDSNDLFALRMALLTREHELQNFIAALSAHDDEPALRLMSKYEKELKCVSKLYFALL